MNTLEIFLKSLEKMRSDGMFYVSRYVVTPTKINCLETHLIEVYLVDYTNNKELISSVSKNYNTTEYTINSIKEELYVDIITKILEYYNLTI